MSRYLKSLLSAGLLAGLLWAGLATAQGLGGPATPALPPGSIQADPQEVDRLMKQITQDPESMRLIQQLQNDPEMQKVLQDPELVKAAQEQDAARLARDPRVQALQNNKNVRKLIERTQ